MKVTVNYNEAQTNQNFTEKFKEYLEYFNIQTQEVEELRKVG